MELRDLVKIFEEKKFDPWLCPLIKRFCDHQCYGFKDKGFSLLIKHSEISQAYWSQRFEESDKIMQWGRSLKKKVIVTSYVIHPPYCEIFDSLTALQYGFEGLQCQNV